MTPAALQLARRALAWLNALAVYGLLIVWAYAQSVLYSGDAHDYWLSGDNLRRAYEVGWNVRGGMVYSPAFVQAIAPVAALSWPVFYAAWSGMTLLALVWLLTPLGALTALLVLPPFMEELLSGNIHVWIAVAVVLLPRLPWVSPFLLLTKITPGVGLLWYVARREWRSLTAAGAVTTVVVAVSFVAAPDDWAAWLNMLLHIADAPVLAQFIPIPLWIRFPVAAAIVVYAARSSRPWLLPLAVWLSLPSLWTASIVILAAVPRLVLRTEELKTEDRRQRSGLDVPSTARVVLDEDL